MCFFYPPIAKLSVPALLEHVDVTLVSMHNLKVYRFGISLNKLFDYLCAAKPIVFAGNVVNDIVKESGAGISCQAYDSKAFAQAILRFCAMSKEEREEIGKREESMSKNTMTLECLQQDLKKYFKWRW